MRHKKGQVEKKWNFVLTKNRSHLLNAAPLNQTSPLMEHDDQTAAASKVAPKGAKKDDDRASVRRQIARGLSGPLDAMRSMVRDGGGRTQMLKLEELANLERLITEWAN